MSLLIFQNPYEFFLHFLIFLKNKRNVTNFECFCNNIKYHTQEFPEGLKSCTLIASIFFKNGIFINVEKN